MESSSVAGVSVSLVAAGGESKCVCSRGLSSLGHCSIRSNWAKRGRNAGWVGEQEQGGDTARGCAEKQGAPK